jgi:aspartyl-tRNA(Asn)/glutamyl-tRNA(Gln) amidotransferase subunit C
MKIEDIEKLAQLARLGVSDEEKQGLVGEISTILGFVEQIKEVQTSELKSEIGLVRNIMREDGEPHLVGQYTKDILEQFPNKEKGYLKVKKIL